MLLGVANGVVQLMLWKCLVCSRQASIPDDATKIICQCGYIQFAPHAGLGDLVAAGLHRVGLTPARYANAKAAVGLKRKCGCRKRQRKLNELGNQAAAVLAKVASVVG